MTHLMRSAVPSLQLASNSRSKLGTHAVALLAATVVALALVGTAYAHALPVTITPGDGAVVTARPTEVAADTGEKMTDKTGDNDLIVNDAAGAQVSTGHATVDTTHQHMSVPLSPTLAVGTYTVRWFTVSADDGENASGSWQFTFDPSKAPSAGLQRNFDPGAVRTQLYLGAAGIVIVALLAVGVVITMRRHA